MNDIGFENIQKRCRICMVNLETKAQVLDRTYSELFQKISGCAIKPYEPQKICQKCEKLLLQVKELLKRAADTQVLLEKFFKSMNGMTKNEEIKKEEDLKAKESDLESDQEFIKAQNLKEYNNLSNIHSRPVKSQRKNHDEPEEECQFCKRSFVRLYRHLSKCKSRPEGIENDTTKDKTLHVCPICGNLSTSDHILYHTKSAQQKDSSMKKCFICDICGVRTSSRSNIDIHMKVKHLNCRSFCRHCPGSFHNPSALARHMRKSHSEKLQDYKCRTCDFRTSVEKEARNHRESHRIKKLVCHECGQEFLKPILLKYHMASHSDERPFGCDTCGSTFKTTKALGVHKKTHKAYDYECPVCARGYLTNQLMRSHVEKNHPEFELPPPGTVFSKTYKKKMAERQLKELAIKQGVEMAEVDVVIVPKTVIHQVQSNAVR